MATNQQPLHCHPNSFQKSLFHELQREDVIEMDLASDHPSYCPHRLLNQVPITSSPGASLSIVPKVWKAACRFQVQKMEKSLRNHFIPICSPGKPFLCSHQVGLGGAGTQACISGLQPWFGGRGAVVYSQGCLHGHDP